MSFLCSVSTRLSSGKKSTPPPESSSNTWILTVGKTRSPGVQLLVDEYTEKLKCYLSVEVLKFVLIQRRLKTTAHIREEDNAVMSTNGSDDWMNVETGNDIRSEDMAELIPSAGNTGDASRLSFCIGGPYGHGSQLQEHADVSIKSLHLLAGLCIVQQTLFDGRGHTELTTISHLDVSSIAEELVVERGLSDAVKSKFRSVRHVGLLLCNLTQHLWNV